MKLKKAAFWAENETLNKGNPMRMFDGLKVSTIGYQESVIDAQMLKNTLDRLHAVETECNTYKSYFNLFGPPQKNEEFVDDSALRKQL